MLRSWILCLFQIGSSFFYVNNLFVDGKTFRLDKYHTYEEINSFLDVAHERYPKNTEVITIGTTYEGNPIKGLAIKTGRPVKPVILIDAGFHAREHVAPAVALYIISSLLTGYGKDRSIRQMLNKFDWYIFPVMNPDGYITTWTSDRNWRKNRSPSSNHPTCIGTDPNRNFLPYFGGVGTEKDPCSAIYPGPFAFSEEESRALRDFVLRMEGRVKLYITLHSISQLFMTPYGFTNKSPPDYRDHMKVLKAATEAVKKTHGMIYKFGTISNTIYPATGSSIDWAYVFGKVKYSIAIELRDKGRYGFLLPENQIIPTAQEIMAGIKAIFEIIKNEFRRYK